MDHGRGRITVWSSGWGVLAHPCTRACAEAGKLERATRGRATASSNDAACHFDESRFLR